MLLMLAACTSIRKGRELIGKAEACIKNSPDTALLYLDSVPHPEQNLRRADYMRYALLHVEAAWQSGADVTYDTAVFGAARYYERKGDFKKHAIAELYSGCVYLENGKKDEAMTSLKKASRLGQTTSDSATIAQSQFLIGIMLYNDGHYDLALQAFRTAYKYAGDRTKLKMLILNSMASSHILQSNYDDARRCLDIGLLLAENGDFTSLRLEFLNKYFVMFQQKGEYDSASYYIKTLMRESDPVKRPVFCLNLFKMYSDAGQMDSAAFYGARLLTMLDEPQCSDETRVAAYYYLSEYYEKTSDYQVVNMYLKKYDSLQYEIMKERQQAKILEIQQRYDYEAQQNQYNRQLIKRNRMALSLTVLLFLSAVSVALLMYKTAMRRKQMEHIKDELLSFKKQNKQLQSNLSDRETLNAKMLADCENRLEQELRTKYKVLCQFEIYQSNRGDDTIIETMRNIMYGKKDFWEVTMAVFEQLYPCLPATILKRYPDLSDSDFKSVVLSYFRVSRSDEALLLGMSVDMVDKNRNRIRKAMCDFDMSISKVRKEQGKS